MRVLLNLLLELSLLTVSKGRELRALFVAPKDREGERDLEGWTPVCNRECGRSGRGGGPRVCEYE